MKSRLTIIAISLLVFGSLIGYLLYLTTQEAYKDLAALPSVSLPPPEDGELSSVVFPPVEEPFLFESTPPSEPSPSPVYFPPPQSFIRGNPVLFISPDLITVETGETFSVEVRVNSGGADITAVSAYLEFDPKRLEAITIDASQSAFPIEAEKLIKPGFVRITRGKRDPAFNGASGLVAIIQFKAVSAGSGDILFVVNKPGVAPSQIILDDNRGTNVLKDAMNATYNIFKI